ncbi:MAG: ABC transporter substrate-binding protein [Candidatus Taylorbacteria bacterium]
MEYIKRFSSTEKFIFGVLTLAAIITMIMMASSINNHFLTEIPSHGGELREGIVGLPRTINTIIAVTDADKDIGSLVYAGLTRYDGDTLVADMAKSYTVSNDGLTYDFILRDDIYFQDGIKLTADDVQFTIQKIQDPALKSPRRSDWVDITAKIISPNEIQFLLKQPYGPFLANTTVGIMPKHIWGNVSNDQFIFSEYNVSPVGSGPYKYSSLSRDSGGIPTTYTLETWSKYFGTAPFISKITFNFFTDEIKALAALDNGSIDSMPSVSAGPAASLATDSAQSYKILSTPMPRIFGVFLNQNHNAILADKIVRQALDMSVDRQAIIKTVLNGYGLPMHSPLPTGLDNGSYFAASSTNTNIAGAQALLEKAGWKKDADGIYGKKVAKAATTTLAFDIYTADSSDLKQAANLVQQSWATLGVKVTIKVFEAGDLYQNVIRTRSYDALLFGEQVGKDRDMYAFWHSSQRNAPGLNISMYTNSKADKLLENIRSTSDDSIRTKYYAQLDQIIQMDLPAIFLYSPDFIYATPKSLQGITLSSITVPTDRFSSIKSWYIQTEKVWKIFAK